MADETIIRYVDLDSEQAEKLVIAIDVENGIQLEELEIVNPDWLAITSYKEADLDVIYNAYFLSKNGRIIDVLFNNDLIEEAMGAIGSGVVRFDEWKECDVSLNEDYELIPRSMISK
ncbi:MAG: hypothetical protein ACYC5A_10165 [Thermoleophilia bacterium]